MEFPAIYVNGVFQPTGPVSLPENTPVTVLPTVATESPLGCPAEELHDVLSRSYDTGESDLAARIDELDP
ncbi:MAG: antitoxin family protein [Pirellulales bacterium]|nr:antitoxin family protein [Pirellulales bacterium]